MITFISLIILLWKYQHGPLPDWPRGLSVNTAISFFSVIFKVPVLQIAGEGVGQLNWQ